jgi:hypothetical protein
MELLHSTLFTTLDKNNVPYFEKFIFFQLMAKLDCAYVHSINLYKFWK